MKLELRRSNIFFRMACKGGWQPDTFHDVGQHKNSCQFMLCIFWFIALWVMKIGFSIYAVYAIYQLGYDAKDLYQNGPSRIWKLEAHFPTLVLSFIIAVILIALVFGLATQFLGMLFDYIRALKIWIAIRDFFCFEIVPKD